MTISVLNKDRWEVAASAMRSKVYGGRGCVIYKPTRGQHPLAASSIFSPSMLFFLFVFKSNPKLLSIFSLLTLLCVLRGKYSKLSTCKDLMLAITLDNWLKGRKHAFPSFSRLNATSPVRIHLSIIDGAFLGN